MALVRLHVGTADSRFYFYVGCLLLCSSGLGKDSMKLYEDGNAALFFYVFLVVS